MGTRNFIKVFLLLLISAALFSTSCVKEGPMGLPGTDGIDGAAGRDGRDGVDGTASCVSCHNKTTRALVAMQASVSAHATMPNKQSGANCVACHSSEGFIESLNNVATKTFAAVTNPTGLSCSSCHTTHQTFDFANDGPDYALRTTKPVPMFMNAGITINMGNSNICVNCHQPRSTAPVGDAGGNFSIANFRYGPHYGTQAVVNEGLWGYHHPQGSTPIPAVRSSAHRTGASCTTCHMHDSSTGTTGGHTWKVSPDACKSCHSNITTAAHITASKAEFYALFNELGDKLVAIGAMKPNAQGTLEAIAGTYPINVAGAVFNYRMLYGDHSGGIHNPGYTKALLKNSIEALN